MSYFTVDLRSDTVTKPTLEMRNAILNVEVGDDVYGEDITVNKLEEKSAKLFEKEAAVFVPSGTMANLLAIMVHCNQRGSEAIVGHLSHTFLYEQAGAAQIAGIQLATIRNQNDGTFDIDDLRKKIRFYEQHEPITQLIIVENTHNMCGGKIIPLDWLDQLKNFVDQPEYKERPIALHMDGARIFNASRALGVSVARISKGFDSVSFCLSKGLSAPVGSVLVGSKQFIEKARRLRKALGGGMRQCGVIAIAGIIALDTIVPTLDEDHRRTKLIAKVIHDIQSSTFIVENVDKVHTNILLIQIKNVNLTSDAFAKRLEQITDAEIENGIITEEGCGISLKVSARDWAYARLVLHHDIDDVKVNYAIKKLIYVIKEFDNSLGETVKT